MAITESKLKSGVLTLDAKAFATQATNVKIVPSTNASGDVLETLSGDTLGGDASQNDDKLDIENVQDFDDPAGFDAFCWANRGLVKPFTWKPNASSGQWSGTVEIQPSEIGGEINKRLTTSKSLKIVSLVPPTGFVPAARTTAGTGTGS